MRATNLQGSTRLSAYDVGGTKEGSSLQISRDLSVLRALSPRNCWSSKSWLGKIPTEIGLGSYSLGIENQRQKRFKSQAITGKVASD